MFLHGRQKPSRDQTCQSPFRVGLVTVALAPATLHSASQVSSLRRFDQRDQSAVGFSASSEPNVALVVQGWRTYRHLWLYLA